MLAWTSQIQNIHETDYAELSCEHAHCEHTVQHLLYGVKPRPAENMLPQNLHPYL